MSLVDNTVVFHHFNEDGFKDECGNIWEIIGTPKIDRSNQRFGDGCLYLDGNSYLEAVINDLDNICYGMKEG